MKKRDIHSLRVAWDLWSDETRFTELLGYLKEYPCNISAIALFTSGVHPPLPLKEMESRLKIAVLRMEQVRKQGLSAGINILGTIGHHEEDLDACLRGNYTFMTGWDGRVCRGSYCMNDENFLEGYVRPVYNMLAKASPDFIWIDDDVRYGHMPIGDGCFCHNCISRFNRENSTAHTRESLVSALNSGDMETRRKWLSMSAKTISDLFRLIGSEVRGIDDNIVLGFMTGERYVEGYAFADFASALSEDGKYEIMWRPGGGAYTDYRFDEIVEKAEQVGRQNAYLPDYVTIIQQETENFPYQLIKKTPKSTALEGAWNMTAGCTGAALNILPSESREPVWTVLPHLKAIDRLSPFYEFLHKNVAGKQPCGICTAWSIDAQLAVPGKYTHGWGGMYADFARELFDFGLPQCYRHENASVSVMRGECVRHRTDSEIEKLLSKGVYMDAGALDHLNSRGFSRLTGFETAGEIRADGRELYLSHEINGECAGGIRNCRQAFNPGDSFTLRPTCGESESLSSLIDYHDRVLGECCLGLFENGLGGRVAVGGYYPYTWVSDYYKTVQLKNLMVHLSNNQLPSYVETYCRIRNHSFVDGEKVTVALLNPTNEDLEGVLVAVRTEKDRVCLTDMEAKTIELKKTEQKGAYGIFCIEKLGAYEMAVIEA